MHGSEMKLDDKDPNFASNQSTLKFGTDLERFLAISLVIFGYVPIHVRLGL